MAPCAEKRARHEQQNKKDLHRERFLLAPRFFPRMLCVIFQVFGGIFTLNIFSSNRAYESS